MSKQASKQTASTAFPRFETRKLSELKAHPDGLRSAPPEALHWLGKSLEVFGLLRSPLVLNARTGTLLDGDRMLAALRDAGAEEAAVWVVDLPEELEDAAHLMLNQHAGEWLWEPVSAVLKAVAARGQQLGLTGFHESDTGPLCAAEWKAPEKGPMDGVDAAQGSLL